MHWFEGKQLARFGLVLMVVGVALVVWATASGTTWLNFAGAGVAAVGAMQILTGRDHLRHQAEAEHRATAAPFASETQPGVDN